MTPDLAIVYHRLQQLGVQGLRMLPNIGIAILVLLAFLLAASICRKLVQRASAKRHHKNLVLVLGRITQSGMVLLGALLAITIAFPSFTPANLISALGITGIAIGFAFKDIFENFLAGILILMTEPFRIGDQIVFGAFEGTIEEIQTRATMMRTYDGRMVVIPNSELYKASFIVNTAYPVRRLEYDLVIGNGDDIPEAKKIMADVLKALPGTEPDPPPDVLVTGYADNGVQIRIRWWVKPPRKADAMAIRDQVLEKVKDALTKNGIDLPYPTHQVLFHDQTEETDGDRSRQREGWPAGEKPVPAQYNAAHALSKQDGQRAQTDGADSAALH
jgi:small conductance mechanosensitive channel